MSFMYRPIAIALTLAAVTGCQAPGFMGLSNSSTSPDAATDSSRLVRARFKVLVPQSLAQGIAIAPPTSTDAATSPSHFDDRAVTGAHVYLEGQAAGADTTDDMGFASLALVQGRLTPVRAEFKTPDGMVAMSALVCVDKDAQSIPLFAITLSSTLVTSKIAQKFRYGDLKYLDYGKLQHGIEVVDQAIRTPDGSYDSQYLPRLTRAWSVMDTAQALVSLDPILTRALADVLATAIPTFDVASASPSASATRSFATLGASISPTLTQLAASPALIASAAATASRELPTGDLTLFPADLDSLWVYDLFDADGKMHGQLIRKVSTMAAKTQGVLITGTETGTWGGHSHETRFLMKRSSNQVRFAAAYRPSVDYPLPLIDGTVWQAAPGITAVAHAPAEQATGSWRIDFKQEKTPRKLSWSEWLVPGQGFTRLQWIDPQGHRWEARLQPRKDSASTP